MYEAPGRVGVFTAIKALNTDLPAGFDSDSASASSAGLCGSSSAQTESHHITACKPSSPSWKTQKDDSGEIISIKVHRQCDTLPFHRLHGFAAHVQDYHIELTWHLEPQLSLAYLARLAALHNISTITEEDACFHHALERPS